MIITIQEGSEPTFPDSAYLFLHPELQYNLCTDQMVSLKRDPWYLVPKQAWFLFQRFNHPAGMKVVCIFPIENRTRDLKYVDHYATWLNDGL